jgi:IS605 OrfB family transposase
MQLAEKHIIKTGHLFFEEIDALAFCSKNLYNAANYIIRQNFIYGWGYLNYNAIYKLMKSHEAYKALPAKVSQQILMVLDQNWKSFFEALKAYKETPDSFTGRPKLPKYKDKEKGRNLLVYTVQALGIPALRQGLIKLSGTVIEFPTLVDFEKICQVRIVPKCDCYVIEVIYEKQESTNTQVDNLAIASIDLGLDNLATLTSNQKGFTPLLINGRPLKSINQFYNKRKAELQSKLKGNRKTSPRIQRLTRSRNQKIDNYLHHASHFIVNHLVESRIGTLVIGKNAQWKTEINLGLQTNQNFVTVPHSRFIEMLTYKCDLVGIKVLITEESYTSKASFLDGDFIPTYGDKDADSVVFSGKRVKRGLYKSKDGTLINADVNGSCNIMRKVIPTAFTNGIGSCVVQPRRIEPLKVKAKGKAAMPSKAL